MSYFFLSAGAILFLLVIYRKNIFPRRVRNYPRLPQDERDYLMIKVAFYRLLEEAERPGFESRLQDFLDGIKITGVECEIDRKDELLIAASALIPIYNFPKWRYDNLNEVIIYPNAFNHRFETEGRERAVLGMVGEGVLGGKMLLSKRALHQGFDYEQDKKNTAIHEFIHLIDMMDGKADGIPEMLIRRQYSLPWIHLIHEKIKEIHLKKSDIRAYGGLNTIEFFAVASEYFFERPDLLKKKHPRLYSMLEEVFENR